MTKNIMNIFQASIPNYIHTGAFDTVALCLRESIRELGFSSEIYKYPSGKCIVLGAHLISELPENCIIYNLEQITSESPFVNESYVKMLKKHKVWDYSKRNIKELNKLGIDAIHMPIGYHQSLTKIPISYEDIECLFYGSINSRRAKIIHSVNGCRIFNVYGIELDYWINRSKIILNCHYYETKLFEIVRCSYALANKKFILSEPGLDIDLEEPFKEGIAFYETEEWPEVCKFYLKNPDARNTVAQKGYQIFSNMKQTEYLKNESKSW